MSRTFARLAAAAALAAGIAAQAAGEPPGPCRAGAGECVASSEEAASLLQRTRAGAGLGPGPASEMRQRGLGRGPGPVQRCRCTNSSASCWPREASWRSLNFSVGGRLLKGDPGLPQRAIFSEPALPLDSNTKWNQLWIQNQSELTINPGASSGWVMAVSPYVVAVERPLDIAKAVKFAAKHDLRLVVKGAGHDYIGRSSAPNSLLIWTQRLQKIRWHKGNTQVTVQAGVIWEDVYREGQERGRHVTGGSCPTVGAAGGFPLGGGFGDAGFSRRDGMAVENMVKATVITASGRIVVASKISHPKLFWALRGGGGGTFAVVYDITYKTHKAPQHGGVVKALVEFTPKDDKDAWFNFTEKFLAFVNNTFLTRNWGGAWYLGRIGQGLVGENQEGFLPKYYFWDIPAENVTAMLEKFKAEVNEDPKCNFQYLVDPPPTMTVNGKTFLKIYPEFYYGDANREGIIPSGRPGQFIYKGYTDDSHQYNPFYKSAYVSTEDYKNPKAFAQKLRVIVDQGLGNSIYFSTSKAMGGDVNRVEKLKRMSIDPRVWQAGSLALLSNGHLRGYWRGRTPTKEALDLFMTRNKDQLDQYAMENSENKLFKDVRSECKVNVSALTDAEAEECWGEVDQLVDSLTEIYKESWVPGIDAFFNGSGSYSSESWYYEADWQTKFWGENYAELYKTKQRLDPKGLFVCHHCVGSEDWSDDGNCLLPKTPH